MKIISWNVNGIRAVLKKGFLDFVEKEKPDIICLQETKAHPEQVDEMLKQYKHHFWNSAERKGYSGTVIFSKDKPISVIKNIDLPEHDREGRVITLEWEEFYLVTVYVPNSGRGLVRLNYRRKWDKDFLTYLKNLEKKKPVLVCGDFNVAHTEIDLANPKSNYNKTAGYTQAEIDGFNNFITAGFIDTFREFNKEGGNYTYWTPRFKARQKNIGWRIDYFLISPALRPRLSNSFLLPKIGGSDHCPIEIILK